MFLDKVVAAPHQAGTPIRRPYPVSLAGTGDAYFGRTNTIGVPQFGQRTAGDVSTVAGSSGIGLALCDAGTPLPDQRDDLLVQQRIEGRHVSTLSLLVDGRSLVTVCYEGTVYAGTVAICFERVDDEPAVLAWVNRFCGDLSYTGFIAFDFIVDAQGVPWAIECNPRVTSGIHFLDEAALGSALADLPAAQGIPVRRDQKNSALLVT